MRTSSTATRKCCRQLQTIYPDATLVPIECDLQSFESVKNAIAEIKSKYSETGIYCMACNAGIMATPDKATVDGYDTQMQTNHLSHFLLIEELMEQSR
ncbi:unnamed protein product [Cylindrotheca closterium]|uniref:Protochlorophyllide reductase n=1 Tax=Cylindrotheca closterium TaxID=2856 RepID=A0AAD2CEW5_9STRA|nr:unnamed protein product [Cylindrotheca closterium]